MKVIVEPRFSNEENWKFVRRTARQTVGKEDLDKPVTNDFKRRMLLSRHSCIRELKYIVELKGIPTYIAQQISRHAVAIENNFDFVMKENIMVSDREYYVKTQRSDRTGVDRSNLSQVTPVDMMITTNAQGLIDMSKKRMCNKASFEARELWNLVVEEMRTIDTYVADSMMPECCWQGFCSEGGSEKCYESKIHMRVNYIKKFLGKTDA